MSETGPRDAATRDAIRRRGVALEYVTIAWNVGEAFITIALGVAAGSIALVAFGLDSIVEVFASGVVVWHSRHPETSTARTSRAVRLIAIAFFTLAVFLTIGAVQRLVSEVVPEESPVGIAYLAFTVVVMFTLARLKHRAGAAIGDEALLIEARITYLDAALATGVLLSLAVYASVGWTWVDPAAALLVAAVAIREGIEAWRGGLG